MFGRIVLILYLCTINNDKMDDNQIHTLKIIPHIKKYALGNLLLIDDTQDADATNTHGKTSAPVAKSKLDVGDAAFEKAKAFIANGGSLDAIKTKYDLTDAALKELTP